MNKPGWGNPFATGMLDSPMAPLGIRERARMALEGRGTGPQPRKHAHYFKPCPYAEIDVYRVLQLFAITDQCLGHALKKLLVAGGRGAGKDIGQDVQEAIDSLLRWQEMRREEEATPPPR